VFAFCLSVLSACSFFCFFSFKLHVREIQFSSIITQFYDGSPPQHINTSNMAATTTVDKMTSQSPRVYCPYSFNEADVMRFSVLDQ